MVLGLGLRSFKNCGSPSVEEARGLLVGQGADLMGELQQELPGADE